jgi:4-hydroxy-tetrahydrodipicolinate reductase
LRLTLWRGRSKISQSHHPNPPVRLDQELHGFAVGDAHQQKFMMPRTTSETEVIFGNPDERLHFRHEAGSGAGLYVAGTLLAIREVTRREGVTRGLDSVLFPPGAA